jgi:hypothetical protein
MKASRRPLLPGHGGGAGAVGGADRQGALTGWRSGRTSPTRRLRISEEVSVTGSKRTATSTGDAGQAGGHRAGRLLDVAALAVVEVAGDLLEHRLERGEGQAQRRGRLPRADPDVVRRGDHHVEAAATWANWGLDSSWTMLVDVLTSDSKA